MGTLTHKGDQTRERLYAQAVATVREVLPVTALRRSVLYYKRRMRRRGSRYNFRERPPTRQLSENGDGCIPFFLFRSADVMLYAREAYFTRAVAKRSADVELGQFCVSGVARSPKTMTSLK